MYHEFLQSLGHKFRRKFDLELAVLRNYPRLAVSETPLTSEQKRVVKGLTGESPETVADAWLLVADPVLDHRLRCLSYWAPGFSQNPWSVRMFDALDRAEAPGKQMCHFLGSQNSGKTETLAHHAVQMLLEDPDNTAGYIAGPYQQAAKLGLWANTLEAFQLVCPFMKWDYDKCHSKADNSIRVNDFEKAGFLRVTTLDNIGMLQGRKPKSYSRGWLILYIDETGTFKQRPAYEIWEVMQNLLGAVRFRCYTGCNFKSTTGLDGILSMPRGRDYSDLHVDNDQEWESTSNGDTHRFDGHDSPNLGIDPAPYPFLIKQNDIDAMIERGNGPKSPKYKEQIRSFPMTGDVSTHVTSIPRIKAKGAFACPEYTEADPMRVMFVDPSDGGDEFVVGIAEVKEFYQVDGEKIRGVVPITMLPVPLEADRRHDEETLARMTEFHPGHQFHFDSQFTVEMQGALWCRELADQHGVDLSNVGYDGSMRAYIVRAMDFFFGNSTLAVDYGGKPPDVLMPSGNINALDGYSNFAAYVYFLCADMLEEGRWKEADGFIKAVRQLCDRQWEWRGSRKILETKEIYKLRNAQQSPNEADVMCGLSFVAYRRLDVMPRGTSKPDGHSLQDFLLKMSPGYKLRQREVSSVFIG